MPYFAVIFSGKRVDEPLNGMLSDRYMKYEAIVFDLDGTLIDTIMDITRSLNSALVKMGFSPLTPADCQARVGWGLFKLVQASLPDRESRDEYLVRLLTEEMISEYRMNPTQETRPYPGISALLQSLQQSGYPIFVWTNKEQSLGEIILAELFPGIVFTGIIGDIAGRPKKPDPSASSIILSKAQTSPERVIYLGDSDVDMETAAKCRFHAVGVLWGYRSRKELLSAGAETLAETPEEILNIIRRGCNAVI